MTQDELKVCTDCLKAGGDVTYEEADGIFRLLCCSKTPEEVGLLLEWYRAVLDRLEAGKGNLSIPCPFLITTLIFFAGKLRRLSRSV